ncbi:DUF3131 domain-containing protein, partial [Aliivibrio sifiae]
GLINTFTSNNNGITLEILLYKEQGKLLTYKDNVVPSLWEKALESPFGYEGQCLPRKPMKPSRL